MFLKTCQGLAPSILAASWGSAGSVLSAARIRIVNHGDPDALQDREHYSTTFRM